MSETTTPAASGTAAGAVPRPRDDAEAPPVDQERLGALVGKVVTELGAVVAGPLVLLGDRLGLFTALARGPADAGELAARTGLDERYLREWLLAMAASEYVDHLGDGRFSLSPEQRQLFCEPDSPAFVVGGFQLATTITRALDRTTEAFRTGAGMGWHEHHEDLFEGTERFFRPSYLAQLTTSWIPALDGLEERLQAGAAVADVGCGFGASTIIMAQAYPASRFVGSDYHGPSIEAARERAAAAGVGDAVTFEVAGAEALTRTVDLVTMFDCLHDMPDPLAALRSARASVADDGWVMLVEPVSGDDVDDALNPVGRLYAASSVYLCLPSGLSAEPRAGLGNQTGPSRILALAAGAGFSRAREATRGPFNAVYELRP